MDLLHNLFENSARLYPDSVAIKAPKKSLTYSELSVSSNILAEKLLDLKVEPNQLVAIVMEKDWEQVVAVLGILKSGAAYLPIDYQEPDERLVDLLNLSKATIILTQKKLIDRFKSMKDSIVIEIDEDYLNTAFFNSDNLTSIQSENDLAYVMYTSGSTGSPKGVMISHHGAINTILDINNRFNVGKNDRIFASSALTFDLSVYDIFGLLAVGGTIVITDNISDPSTWNDICFKENVTIWNSVPALLDIFVEYLIEKYKSIPSHSLRLILLSGDGISLSLPKKIRALFGNIEIISLGGATEASIWSICYPIDSVNPHWHSIPYGKPLKNQFFYILDRKLTNVDYGNVGELYIGGEGVAKGYWQDEQRTLDQFILHPIYGRLYKTGDLGKYLPDGNIEFLGRSDFQVKINGYRIEIGGIEKVLLQYPGIKQVVVLPHGDDRHKRLVAYITIDMKCMWKNVDHSEMLLIEKEQIENWHKIYEGTFRDSKASNPCFNTVGWISSYTNKPILENEMEEWVSNVVDRILSLNPESILEVGCGGGLLLFPLAKRVKKYHGIDCSNNAISFIESQILRNNLNNIQLSTYYAHQISRINERYDTVILNSICQYFPNIEYFLHVLNDCINMTTENGKIFIGDVRSLCHLSSFYFSVLMEKKINASSYSGWKLILDKYIENEDELLIDHNLFYNLHYLYPRVSHVEVLLKEGLYDNEMNRFRYDVILHLDGGKKYTENIKGMPWDSHFYDLNQLNMMLSKNNDCFSVKNIPNKRTMWLALPSEEENWDDVMSSRLANRQEKGIDPSAIYSLGREHGFHVNITWSDDDPVNLFDAIFCKENSSLGHLSGPDISLEDFKKSIDKYANNPLIGNLKKRILCKIKSYLKSKLPEYMVPAHVELINALPVNKNGKIDRRSLLDMLDVVRQKHFRQPETLIEKQVAHIFEKILNIKEIGKDDDFFELGGTSILLIELIIEIHAAFGLELTICEINYNLLTIAVLSELIECKIGAR